MEKKQKIQCLAIHYVGRTQVRISSMLYISILCWKIDNIAKDDKRKLTPIMCVCLFLYVDFFPFLPDWCNSLTNSLFETQPNIESHKGMGKSVGEVRLVHTWSTTCTLISRWMNFQGGWKLRNHIQEDIDIYVLYRTWWEPDLNVFVRIEWM